MRCISLFSGIGGFDLAAVWAGFEIECFVEIDKFCQKVLAKNFPGIPIFSDIKEFNGKIYEGTIDIIYGGFPCQPFSLAGKRKGAEDERALFPEMLRVIQEVKPSWVVAENVYGVINIEDGQYLSQIYSSLEALGYEIQTFVIPACSVNAPHKRDRAFIVANSDYKRKSGEQKSDTGSKKTGKWELNSTTFIRPDCNAHDTDTGRIRRHEHQGIKERAITRNSDELSYSDTDKKQLQRFDNDREYTSQRVFRSDNWHKTWIEVATRLCRVDDGVPGRVDRLKALGNAVVPQVVYEIFECIKEVEKVKSEKL